jgi:hypothetical protein
VLGFKTVLTTGDGQDARGCDRGHSRSARSRKGGGRGGAGAMRGDTHLKGHGSQAGVGGGGRSAEGATRRGGGRGGSGPNNKGATLDRQQPRAGEHTRCRAALGKEGEGGSLTRGPTAQRRWHVSNDFETDSIEFISSPNLTDLKSTFPS